MRRKTPLTFPAPKESIQDPSFPPPKPGSRLFSAYGARNEDIYLNALAAKDVLPLAARL